MRRPSPLIALLIACLVAAGYGLHTMHPATRSAQLVVAQEQSVMPPAVATVSWLLENPQSFTEAASILCPTGSRCATEQRAHIRARREESADGLSRFSLSFDQKKRPIIHYRFAGGAATTIPPVDEP